MKERIRKTLILGTAGLLIVGLTAYSIVLHDQREGYKRQVQGFYNESFEEMMMDINSLESKLGKLEVAGSQNQYAVLLMDVWRQAGDTESSITQLPVSFVKTASFTQFINRMGDYCRYLSKKIAREEDITEEDMKQISDLKRSCREISGQLDETWRNGYLSDLDSATDTYFNDGSGDGMTGNLDFSSQEYPQLIYDGPFSESTENKAPKGLTGSEIPASKAQHMAEKFIGEDKVSNITSTGEANGEIPAYGFEGQADIGAFTIYITKQGGSVLWYMTESDGGISALPTDERYKKLVQIAQRFLKDRGYPDTEPSYAQFYGGMAVINLAAVQDNVVLYPDLIKVWVDIAADTVAGMDCRNYLMSHVDRDIPEAALSEAEARAKVNPALKITNVRLALIPTELNTEELCWEYTGTLDETDYIVYINAVNGMEQDIFMIRHTNEGTLVM